MVTFRNNARRNSFRRNERSFKVNAGRNNHNASKLIDKYNHLAREALSTGDKILSENYFQHADHFTRILSEREIQKKTLENKLSKENEKNFLKKVDNQKEIFSHKEELENNKAEKN